jgi:hypothetical protein
MIQALLYFVIEIAVLGLIYWMLTWALGQIPIPEPFKTIIRVVIVVVIVIIVIVLLLQFLPSGGFSFPYRR